MGWLDGQRSEAWTGAKVAIAFHVSQFTFDFS